MPNLIHIENKDTVTLLTLNRPAQKNALSIKLLNQLCEALSPTKLDGARAVIISGSEGCFSAGADLTDLQGTVDDVAVDEAVTKAVDAIYAAPIPVVAAIDGPCMGAAVDLALACDLRVGSASAYFRVPATRLGLLYNPTAVKRIADFVPRDALFRILVLGERIEATEASRIGLLSYPLSPDESCAAVSTALSILEGSSDNDRAAVAASKGLLNALKSEQYDPDYWNDVRMGILGSPARRAAIEKAKKT